VGFSGTRYRNRPSWAIAADTISRKGINILMAIEKKTEHRTQTTVNSTVGTGYIHLVYDEDKNTIRGRFVGKPDKLGDLRKAFKDAVDELGL
jgi:hypothetical protein